MTGSPPFATHRAVVFADESGVGSALSIAGRLLVEEPQARVWCFHDHRSGEHVAELERLLELKDRHLSRFGVGVLMPREPDEPDLFAGHLDVAKVRTLASKLFDPMGVGEYIVCGSDSLLENVSAAVSGLGVDRSRVVSGHSVEGIRTPTHASHAAAQPGETKVSFVMDGRRRAFVMRTGEESILDAAMRAGIELPFSCKAGVCSTCRTKLVRGEVELAENYALEDWELAQGFVLACQARAKTREIELTYDET